MKLFEVGKIALTLDGILHSTEKRRDEEVKIVTLVLRVQPFDAQLASALPDGVKATLFRLSDGEPKDLLKRVDFSLGLERQNLLVFAAPDTGLPSIAFAQARVIATYARTQKDIPGFAFVLKVSFGPLGRAELEYIQDWHLTQRFVTFEEAEPGMFDDLEAADEDGADDDPEDTPSRPTPMFDDPRDLYVSEQTANRPLHSHQSKRGRKGPTTPPPMPEPGSTHGDEAGPDVRTFES